MTIAIVSETIVFVIVDAVVITVVPVPDATLVSVLMRGTSTIGVLCRFYISFM